MARRMTLEGAKVLGVAEIMPYSNGLPRNIKQCLEDFDIPLYLSHTVTEVFGKDRLEKIELMQVDENKTPIRGTEQYFEADTLLLSVGLIPENHLSDEIGIKMDRSTKGPVVDDHYMTSIDGIFACGNGLHVHDLVDFVTMQAARAGAGAAQYLKDRKDRGKPINVSAGEKVGYTVPSVVYPEDVTGDVEFFFRTTEPLDNVVIKAVSGGKELRSIRKRKIIPSEMERLLLKKELLSELREDVVISVEVIS